MPDKIKLGNVPKSAADCWLHAFSRCDGEMKSCRIHLSLAHWARISAGSNISHMIADDCAEQGLAHVQIFNDQWEPDDSQIARFYIHWDWPPEQLIIIATE